MVGSFLMTADIRIGEAHQFDWDCIIGSDPLYVHMINALPITAATAPLFEKEYVSKEYPYLMNSRSDVEMAWKGYTTSIHAIVDPTKAWEDAQGLVSYELDSALSKSQVLYWISNRPGFNVTVSMPDEPASDDSEGPSSSSSGTGGECFHSAPMRWS